MDIGLGVGLRFLIFREVHHQHVAYTLAIVGAAGLGVFHTASSQRAVLVVMRVAVGLRSVIMRRRGISRVPPHKKHLGHKAGRI